ncbi:MAG: plastocyanin/azurin family copper-binding protein [Chloroflexota bacterium]
MRIRLAALLATAAALVALTAAPAVLAGGGCHGAGTPASVGTATALKIDGCTFLPSIDRVAVGTRVTWVNTSNAQHDVTGTQSAWGSPLLDVGDSYSQTFTQPGIYPYSCSIHPGMAGIIEVAGAGSAAAAEVAPAALTENAPGPASKTSGSPDLAPLAAGAFGLAIGAALAMLIARRRSPAG